MSSLWRETRDVWHDNINRAIAALGLRATLEWIVERLAHMVDRRRQ